MAEVRTKESQKAPVKTLNRAQNMAQRIRSGVKVTEKQAVDAAQSHEESYNAHNADSLESKVKNSADTAVRQTGKATRKVAEKGKEKVEEKAKDAVQRYRQKKAEQNVRQSQSASRTSSQATDAAKQKTTNSKAVRTKMTDPAKKTIRNKAAKSSKNTIKTAGKQSVKTAKQTVRTSKQTAKATIKTSKEAAKAVQKTAKATAKAAKKAAQAARAAAKAAAKAAKAAVKILIKIVQAIIAAIKSLITAIAAGGWVAVIVIVVIMLIALILCSIFGIFYSGEDSGTGMTMRTAVSDINNEFNQEIEDIKSSNTYDVLDMSGAKAEWKEVLAVYAVKMNMDLDNPQEVMTMDESKKQKLRDIFWDMNEISHNITTESKTTTSGSGTSATETTTTTKTLHITVTHKTADEMASQYHFSQDQIDSMHELLDAKYNSLWSSVLHGIVSSNSDIVAVAQEQIGNVGGEPYWSWYGFGSRVEWCCCFVSWCANECGYIDAGVIPKYSVVDDGVNWFKSKGQWIDGSAEPLPGMIIFFDWEYDGLDGSGDHTGIVEKVEGGRVYTIEGNASDKCQELSYSVGYHEILGYGFYESNSSSAGSGDVASQVWTRLKSYGYSDSVAAGIIGNMMRECGGDTLDLDWDIVGHYNGDEFYGLCQWCLSYTPPGFKGSTVIAQCDYLKQTIQSAFANYGGNYGGITYIEFLQSDTRTAAIAFERVYERCGDYANEDNRRANNAERAYNHFH